jgi:hypothetical protein
MAEGFQKYRRREALRAIRERDRARLRELRARIKGLRVRRRSTLAEIRQTCRAERHRVSAEARQLREETRLALKVRIAEMRDAQRGTCNIAKHNARAGLTAGLVQAADELAGERARQEAEKRAANATRERQRERTPKRSSSERRQESDDEVRSNIPRDLVVVFDKVSKGIKAGPRISRTERFFHWAEENPDEVLRIQADAGERAWMAELAVLEREQKTLAKTKGRRLRGDAELAAALAGVPF